MRQIVIDGYNVIRSDPNFRRIEQQSMEDARQALLNLVNSSPRLAGDEVTVVFDGAGNRTFANGFRFGRVKALFSPIEQSADDVIKEQARNAPDPKSLVVVTNDNDIRSYCEGLGCSVSRSENMLGQLPGPKRQASNPRHHEESDGYGPSTGTKKKGNPRKLSKRAKRDHDYRF
jgi:predicted RNA-binding protein with PIN domain